MRPEYSLSSAKGRWILLAAILASSSVFLVGIAVVVALPQIQSYFASSVTAIQWLVNGSLLAVVTLLLVGGSLGDHYGRKRVLILGTVVFAAAGIFSGVLK